MSAPLLRVTALRRRAASDSASPCRASCSCVCWSSRHGLDAGAALLQRRPDCAGAGQPRRLRRPAVGYRPDVRALEQPVRHGGLQAVEHPGAEHQHDRRGARLELVHQPDRLDRGIGRRDRARARDRAAARSGKMGDHPREDRGRQPGLHGERCQRRDVVSRVRSSQQSRGRHRGGRDRHQAVLGAGLQPGRDVHHDVRSEARGDRSEGDRAATLGRRGRRSRATT